MNKKTVKSGILIMSILAFLLIIAQIVVMCLPYIELLPIKVRDRQDPARYYSLQDYCWLETENMQKIFTQKIATGSGFDRVTTPGPHYISNYNTNAFVMDLVLVNVFGILAVIFLIFAIKNQIADYNLGAAGFVKAAAGVCTTLWGGWGLYTFSSGLFLHLGTLAKVDPSKVNSMVPTICLAIAAVGLAAGLISLVLQFIGRTRYKVVKPGETKVHN